jgi:predicted phage terminase large subunit-like protein
MTSLQLSPQQAATELLRRRRARDSLIDYSRFTNRAYRPADHHVQIAEALERVERGECKRLMIFMPPRHGKSELASRRFPAWFMGRHPERSIIAASYNSDLAGDFGREVRNIMASPEHEALFSGSKLAQDSKSQNRWHTDQGGGYTAAGVGTAITGRGAHVLLIDDPVKDREAADSEVVREKTYRWYLSTAYTRLEGVITDDDSDPLWRDIDEAKEKGEAFDGAVVLIQTRWHEDDLAGRLLHDMERGADQWEVLSLPAINEGQALWPAKYPIKRLEQIKATVSPREWSSLFQQEPTAEDGDTFKREWFESSQYPAHQIGDMIQQGNVYLTGDYAVTADGGDYTEIAAWSILPSEHVYCVGWWSGQVDQLDWCEELLDMVSTFKPLKHIAESGVIRKATESYIKRRMRERKDFVALEWMPTTQNKLANARSFQAMASNGRVHFPDTVWAERVISQLLRFPGGRYDDAVDACGLMGRFIDQMWQSQKPKKTMTLEQAWNQPMTINQMLGKR